MGTLSFIKKNHFLFITLLFISFFVLCVGVFVIKSRDNNAKRFGSIIFRSIVVNQDGSNLDINNLYDGQTGKQRHLANLAKATHFSVQNDLISALDVYESLFLENNRGIDQFFKDYSKYMASLIALELGNSEKFVKYSEELGKSKYFKFNAMKAMGFYFLKNGKIDDAKYIFNQIVFDANDSQNNVSASLVDISKEVLSYIDANS